MPLLCRSLVKPWHAVHMAFIFYVVITDFPLSISLTRLGWQVLCSEILYPQHLCNILDCSRKGYRTQVRFIWLILGLLSELFWRKLSLGWNHSSKYDVSLNLPGATTWSLIMKPTLRKTRVVKRTDKYLLISLKLLNTAMLEISSIN